MYAICEKCGNWVNLEINAVECARVDKETVEVLIWIEAFCDKCKKHTRMRVKKTINLVDLLPAFAKIPIHGWDEW